MKTTFKRFFRWSDIRSLSLIGVSILTFYAARMLSLALRYDFDFGAMTSSQYYTGVIMSLDSYTVLAKVFFLGLFGQYTGILKYYGITDLEKLFYALCTYIVVTFLFMHVAPNGWLYVNTPRSVLIIDLVLSFLFWGGVRTGLRMVRESMGNSRLVEKIEKSTDPKNVAIIGAGDVGAELVEEIENKSAMGMNVVALFDDNPGKWRSRIHGVKVLGAPILLQDPRLRNKLELDEVIITMPSASPKRLSILVETLQTTKLPYRIVPSMSQLAMGDVDVTKLRKVKIEDLLERDPIKLDTENIKALIKDKTVFVTGAGGSIGSELCRQILDLEPKYLILIEQCEIQMFLIQQELLGIIQTSGSNTIVYPGIADIADHERMDVLFNHYKPEIVFHAAAHKHVPLMECQPSEAVKNNTFATAHLAEMAKAYNVERFIMISTDKAINPTNVMGASKRMAELYMQSLAKTSTTTKFMAVRFGNVLGSSGSVIPTFRKQIEHGGPVTVTHRDITRFFMTIPEAVGLVLQCAIQGQGGDIFVLDMGEPVKISDLAKNMIRLSGLEPGKDIEIKYVGLRPGEKLFEELSYKGENVVETQHPKIMRFISEPRDLEELKKKFIDLQSTLHNTDYNVIKKKINVIVSEYRPFLEKSI